MRPIPLIYHGHQVPPGESLKMLIPLVSTGIETATSCRPSLLDGVAGRKLVAPLFSGRFITGWRRRTQAYQPNPRFLVLALQLCCCPLRTSTGPIID